MGAFSPIWDDIDQTPRGRPYVVSSGGWGWSDILLVLALPASIS